MKKNEEKFEKVIKVTEMANDYIRLHTIYEYAMSYKEQDKEYVLPKEAEIFLNIQKDLKKILYTFQTKGIQIFWINEYENIKQVRLIKPKEKDF